MKELAELIQRREKFNNMIEDCKSGKIDMIITKSISRFARNTLDTLNYVRTLKELGIGVVFEKENIDTLDSKGEVLLTILSSLAQDESRSISENSTWEIRRKFE
ncbi:recombinase family protein [Clostridium sp. 29_15]|uniref:recombinase family protein n=1 Tax=Clostridium sp. 29_15 TaxID=1896982 RepID=UPI000AB2393F